jgi:hypothetical protein
MFILTQDFRLVNLAHVVYIEPDPDDLIVAYMTGQSGVTSLCLGECATAGEATSMISALSEAFQKGESIINFDSLLETLRA